MTRSAPYKNRCKRDRLRLLQVRNERILIERHCRVKLILFGKN